MNFDQAYNIVNNITGWNGENDLRVLYDYASITPGPIVEIGCYAGRSTVMLALASGKKVTTIDPHIGYEDIKNEFFRNTKDYNIELISKKSNEVEWKTKIGLLFVDGSHEYKDVKEDIAVWTPRMKKHGIMLFHDYEAQVFGVAKAVNEAFPFVLQESGIGVVIL